MHPVEFLSTFSTLMIATAVLLIAAVMLQAMMLYRRKERLRLRTYTHEVLKEDLHWRLQIRKTISRYSQSGRWGESIWSDSMEMERESWQSELIQVLDYCENISLGLRHGIYDEETIRDSYANLFVVLYAHVERFIHERRYESNNPETYGAYTWIVEKWQYHKKYERLP